MKKKIFSMILFLTFSLNAFCQLFVEDITAIATAIENGLVMYQDLQNAIQQYQKICEQLENTKKQMESFDFSSYDYTKFSKFKNAATDFLSIGENMENLIESKSMKVGNLSFSLKDLYTTNFYSKALSEAEKNLNPANMTEEQKKDFKKRHGLDPSEWYLMASIQEEIGNTSAKVKVKVQASKEAVDKIKDQLKDISLETGGDKQAQDTQNTFLKASADIALAQLDILTDTLQSIDNMTGAVGNFIKRIDDTIEESTKSDEVFHASRSFEQTGSNSDYLNMWGK